METPSSAAVPRIYLTSPVISPELYEQLFATLPPRRRASVERLLRAAAREQAVVGFCLVRYAIYAETGRVFDGDWQISAGGKPYLTDAPFFNLSHCASAVAVAISSEAEVGIDIEPLLPRDPRLAKRLCSPTELATLEQADNPERATLLLWSAKEAEGKRRGTGLENATNLSTEQVAALDVVLDGKPHILTLSPARVCPAPIILSPEQLLL